MSDRPFLNRVLHSLRLLLFLSVVAGAAETPRPGSPQRKEILNALRAPVEKQLEIPVLFRVTHLKIENDWAFLKGTPRTKNDEAIDYSKTPLAEEAEVADELLVAVLRKTDGQWQVVEHAIFTTDVWWHGIHDRLGAPSSIFEDDEP
ncbi:MAG: hypothetical protein ACQKBU_10530 [Verrucomicrobiales bacterium]